MTDTLARAQYCTWHHDFSNGSLFGVTQSSWLVHCSDCELAMYLRTSEE
jgi:hypothetical protein